MTSQRQEPRAQSDDAANVDGAIDLEALEFEMTAAGDMTSEGRAVIRQLQRADTNGDGKISAREMLVVFLNDLQAHHEERPTRARMLRSATALNCVLALVVLLLVIIILLLLAGGRG